MSLNANVHIPVAHAALRSDDELDGAPLLALLPSLWPGGDDLFAYYSAGQQVTVASTIRIGESDGEPAVVLEVSAAERPAFLRIGLKVSEHGNVIAGIREHRKVGLMTIEDFGRLSETKLSPELSGTILVIDLALPTGFDQWAVANIC